MSIRRTNSINLPSSEQLEDQQSIKSASVQLEERKMPRFPREMLASGRSQRIPNFMKETLKKSEKERAQEREKSQINGEKESEIGNVARSKIFEVRNVKLGEICEVELKEDFTKPKMCDCEHSFNFCQSCLHHYVIYKVKTFEEVFCPREGCLAILNTNEAFFKQLPIDIQRNYNKLHQFYETSKDPTKKLCPRQNCCGLICSETERLMICNVCKGQYCGLCLLPAHNGQCQKKEMQFFLQNLHYRQCKQCKFIIEKNQGCNHMTCRCKYQFCYVCGAVWNSNHYDRHNDQGIPIANRMAPFDVAPQIPVMPEERNFCFTCFYPFFLQLIKIIFKIVAFLAFPVVMAGLFALRDSIIITGILIFTFFTGIFGFSFELLFYFKGILRILGIIFFPIFAMGGIGMAFKQIFFVIVKDLLGHFWQIGCTYCRWIVDL